MAGGGSIDLTDGQTGTLLIGNTSTGNVLTLADAGNSSLTFEAGGTGVDLIDLGTTRLMTLNAGGASVNITPVGPLGPGTYPLMKFGAGSTLTGSFTLNGGPTVAVGFNSATLQTTATSLNLVVTGVAFPATAYWTGSQNTTSWSTLNGSNMNFSPDATGAGQNQQFPGPTTAVFFSADNVINTGTLNTTLDQNFDIGSLTFRGSGSSANRAVAIGGNVLGIEHDLTVESGSGGATINVATLSLPAAVPHTFTNNSATPLVITSSIIGGGALTTGGTGTTQLLGANSYAGNTVVTGGVLLVSNSLALQNSTLAGVSGGGAVVFDSVVTPATFTLGNLSGSFDLSLQNNAANAANIIVGGNNNATPNTYSGVLSGTGGLTKQGTGQLILANANTYSGNTTISGGTVLLQKTNSLQNTTVNVTAANGLLFDSAEASHAFTLGGLAGSSNIALTDSATNNVALTFGGNNSTTTYSGVFSGGGSLTKLGKRRLDSQWRQFVHRERGDQRRNSPRYQRTERG